MRTMAAGKPVKRVGVGIHGDPRRHRAHGERGRQSEVITPSDRLTPPPANAFYTPGGSLRHAWCGSPLALMGRRGGIEIDFYCGQCLEHVTLPECILPRLPVRLAGS